MDRCFNLDNTELLIGRTNKAENGFTFVECMGRGSFGEVWKAKRVNKSGEVGVYAIKIIKKSKHASAVADTPYTETLPAEGIIDADTFNEAKIQKLFSDRGKCDVAVCLRGYYAMDGQLRLVMDFVEGDTLLNYARNLAAHPDGVNPSVRTRDILMALIKQLKEMHQQGIVHQDIKLENIMWDTNLRTPRFIDWGLGCVKDRHCVNNVCGEPCGVIGTQYLNPPEMRKYVAEIHERNKTEEPLSFNKLRARDVWGVAATVLEFHKISTNTNVDLNRLIISIHSIGSQNIGINAIKKTLNVLDDDTKNILGIMLNPGWKKRIHVWDEYLNSKAGPSGSTRAETGGDTLVPRDKRKNILRLALCIVVVLLVLFYVSGRPRQAFAAKRQRPVALSIRAGR